LIMSFEIRASEVTPFDVYFASVCSMQYHPGAGTKEHKKLSIDECRDVAIDMVIARRSVIGKLGE